MSAVKFFGLTCMVFLVVGPLVPIPTIAITAAVSTGDINKLSGMFLLSPMSYFFGWLTALEIGSVFAICTWLLARYIPSVVPWNRVYLRALLGAALGATIGFLFVVPGLISRLSSMRMSPPFKDDLALSLLVWWRSDAQSSFAFFILPTMVCGVIASVWLLPRLLANRPLHPTACGVG